MTEFGFIDRIKDLFATLPDNGFEGIGDDCAVLGVSGPLCVSTDLFMEDVHFRRSYFTPEDIGWKALAVNLSDLAAEAPQSTPVADLRDMVNSGGPRLLRMVSLIRRNPVTVDRSDDRPGATLVDIAASFNRLPESERRESEIVGFLGGLGAVSGNAIADEPSTDGVGVGVDSDIATEPAPAQRGDTATWHCVSIDGEPRNWITRPVLADMDELSIIVEEG